MADTYSQIYIQIVFAVKGRQNLIRPEFKTELQKYMSGIIKTKGQKMIAINNMPDHFHILVGLRPDMAVSNLANAIKANSSAFIHEKRWIPGRFEWQHGFGAFSYGHSQLGTVVRYIENQERHHSRRTFREEYLLMLKRFGIQYKEQFLFEPTD